MLEQYQRMVDDGTVKDKFKYISGTGTTASIGISEQVVRADLGANITVSLPPVSLAEGKLYSVYVRTVTTFAMTLQDLDDSEDWADKTLDADADGILLYSDGTKWWVVTNDIA